MKTILNIVKLTKERESFMKWNNMIFNWKKIVFCIIGAMALSSIDAMADKCEGKAGERLQPGTITFEVCVSAAKCVASYGEKAYCSKAQKNCTPKSDGCEYSSACYSLPDSDNQGITNAAPVAGAPCQVNEGKNKKPGVVCKFTTTVAAGGYLDCHCECGQNIPVPDALAFVPRQELTGVAEKNCTHEATQSFQHSTVQAKVNFINNSPEKIQIFSLNEQGKRVLYKTLSPHQSVVVKTFIKHPLVITDKNGACKRLVIIDKKIGTVITNK
jgi:hypothetical protein